MQAPGENVFHLREKFRFIGKGWNFIGRSNCFIALPSTIFIHPPRYTPVRREEQRRAEREQKLSSRKDFTELIWQIRLEY